ncbi:MAG: SDR family oxidoreductase [Burkholderiaceae bacterium]|jgi:NAD(P)-dependent dehydrogenase (short-subunit alcohol dehydrogenase family)|nr:SDR family oxidoreductase [Burkholderiales bacterium]MCZ8100751.1 SDR family oxidoreductase [Burkholderiales bacterium]MCZ8337762.1 SDR family oxidoreductase [Burkholderiaceae bacterium]
MKLESKVALVTGGAQGIGLACASRFADEGAKVAIVDVDAARGADAVAKIGTERALFVAGDVAKAETVSRAVAATLERFGAIDVLLNNAGVTHAADFLELAEADFDRVLGVNLKSYFLFGQAVAKWMVGAKRSGAIVNMSSVNAVIAIPNQVPYCVSKGGVAQLTKVMAISLAPKGIRVNAIGPGTIATELARNAVLGSPAAERTIMSRTPLGRLGEPDEIAKVAVFLAGDDGSYLTGQTVYPDGGRLALNYLMASS